MIIMNTRPTMTRQEAYDKILAFCDGTDRTTQQVATHLDRSSNYTLQLLTQLYEQGDLFRLPHRRQTYWRRVHHA